MGFLRKISFGLERILSKKRIDQVIVERGILKSRSEAKRFILEGKVLLNGGTVRKANILVRESDDISLKEPKKFVGRGGLKLEKALKAFNITINGKIAADIGASTGGFTDCLLKNGAQKVYAVDVGYGQIDFKLRMDPRVVLLERTNARYLSEKEILEPLDLVVIDVSFISILKILPAISPLIKEDADIVSLIKPQFEGKREYLKKGIVKDNLFHIEILKNLITNIRKESLTVVNATFSPIKGGKGNIEFFFHIKKQGNLVKLETIYKIVNDAWEKL